MNFPSSAEIQERLATWAERYRVPGAAVGWMHGDETQVAATGVTNMTTGAPVTPDTVFQIGSITKVYTATVVMGLVDEGRIALDEPVVSYLPGLRFGTEEATRTVTVRHLLTHTSGVDGDFFEDFGRGAEAVERYVQACERLPQVFPPGAMWSYCNAGYVVLGRLVEVLTGRGWEGALRQRLLNPIGAADTVTLPEQAILRSAAIGHMVAPDLTVSRAPVWSLSYATGPAGATPCATAADLLKFARVHIDGGTAAGGARIISGASVRAMQEPQVSLPAVPGEFAQRWGLGWMLFDWDGRRVIGHDGGTLGQSSSLRVIPEERFAVAALSNSVGGALLNSRVLHWFFDELLGIRMPGRPKPPEVPAALDLEPYCGVYERVSLRITVRSGGDGLEALHESSMEPAGQQPAMRLVPVDEHLFLQENSRLGTWDPVTFSGFEDGRPRYLFLNRVARRVDG